MKKRLIAISLALSMALSLTGCKEGKQKQKNEEYGYKIENYTNDINGLYQYIVNPKYFENSEFDLPDSISFAKLVDEDCYTNNKKDGAYLKNEVFFRDNRYLLIPDCFNYGDPNIWMTSTNFNYSLKYQVLKTYTDYYLVVENSIEANKDIAIDNSSSVTIKKGDNMKCIAIYTGDGKSLLAFKQYGVGSNSKNIIAAQVGDVDNALQTVKLDKIIEIDYEDLEDLASGLNSDKQNILSRKK